MSARRALITGGGGQLASDLELGLSQGWETAAPPRPVSDYRPVTRERIPSFDLYAELEVSRLASTIVIEAAYRSLVKHHHPDVVASDGDERIKRLNTAREWLVDPARRKRYDRATSPANVWSSTGPGRSVRYRKTP